jgi:hypothetical protein
MSLLFSVIFGSFVVKVVALEILAIKRIKNYRDVNINNLNFGDFSTAAVHIIW